MKLRAALGMLLLVLALLALTGTASADVWLPAALTEIEAQAFMNASWLSGACTIPEGTRVIGSQAFYGCSGITSLTIPGSVTYIGSGAFAGCTSLAGSVTIPEGCEVAADAFNGCVNLTVIYNEQDPSELFTWRTYRGEVTITGYKGGKSVTSVTVPAQIDGYPVTAIDSYAFSSSRYLTSITLPSTLESMGNYAFAYCSRLQSITMPSSVASLGRYAFYYCSALEGSIELVDTEIPSNAFTGCKYLSVFNYTENDDGTLSLSRYYGSQTSVTVPSYAAGRRVTAIGREAFSYRTSLRQVSLPKGITAIGQSAFYYCTALESISLPYGVASIGPSAFYNCTSLSEAKLPYSIASIGSLAFSNCSSLSGTYAFIDADIHSSAFNGCSSATVWCYERTGEIGLLLTSCVSTGSELTIPAYVEDYIVTGMGAQALYGCKNVKSVVLPETFTSIGDQAFYRCTTLQSISIPHSVAAIGEGAFYGCTALGSVTIPSGVTSVGERAFYGCTSMTSLIVESGATKLDSYAFAGCTALVSVAMPGNRSNVGDMAFNNTPWLSDQVTAIARQVTAGCSSSYDKALALHDWLVENTAYDLSYTHYGSEGVLFHGAGVCNAYTLTYSRLLSAVGIQNQTVTGVAMDKNSGSSGSHAWTLVLLDGHWYHVDTTWDDPLPDGRERHTYFCLTDEEMARDHSWDTSAYPDANGTSYSLRWAEVEGETDKNVTVPLAGVN
ncbi:MAG: leucine-rich repeat protein [Clostridia bacterium]|nr:leucine-rich repeat protein [Clostridia bacterium]